MSDQNRPSIPLFLMALFAVVFSYWNSCNKTEQAKEDAIFYENEHRLDSLKRDENLFRLEMSQLNSNNKLDSAQQEILEKKIINIQWQVIDLEAKFRKANTTSP